MAKRGLGRGIDALLEGRPLEELARGEAVVSVPIDKLKPNDEQPRKRFDEAALNELSESIKEKGIIQPLIVEDIGGDEYRIIAGERRYRAARKAGLTVLPVIPRVVSEEDRLELALIENLQREDLNPIEEARAFQMLMDLASLKQEALAKRIGKNRSTIANSLRLLKLPKAMQEALIDGSLSAGHARALLSIGDPAHRKELSRRILSEGLSVRQTEALAAEMGGAPAKEADGGGTAKQPGKSTQKGPELKEMEEKLIHELGTKVLIKGSEKKGRIEIEYYSMEDLERLYGLLSGDETAGRER